MKAVVRRLNLGAGGRPLLGYTNVDLGYALASADWGALDYTRDEAGGKKHLVRAAVYPLEGVPDDSCAEVRASHILEHFPHAETLNVLREWVRVLAPGGVLKLAVPDFDRIIAVYQSGAEAPVEGWVMGGQQDERDYHHALFNRDTLAGALGLLGLVEIQEWQSEVDDCAALGISLNLQGTKPGGDAVPTATGIITSPEAREAVDREPLPAAPITLPAGAVKAVMSIPRLVFADNMFCAMAALAPLGIGLERRMGVFWDQAMENLFQAHLADGTRYLLTIDYDSLFTKADVLELCRLMETRPELDALCAVQMRRDKDSPLFTVLPAPDTRAREVRISRTDLERETLPLATGHFGLTLVRVESLKRLPRPWFHHRPDVDGTWGDGRMDADIHFWHQFREAGCQLHQANRVVIGHAQLVATWPDQNLKAQHQFISDYHADGKPAWAWR